MVAEQSGDQTLTLTLTLARALTLTLTTHLSPSPLTLTTHHSPSPYTPTLTLTPTLTRWSQNNQEIYLELYVDAETAAEKVTCEVSV